MAKVWKVVLIGESGVGKTSIISKFTQGVFDSNQVTSSTAQFIRKTQSLEDGKSVVFDICDTPGREQLRSMAKIFYKDAKAILLVYDITNRKSFEEMKNYWYKEIKKNCISDFIVAIAANKSDLYEYKEVDDSQGKEFAKKINALFLSTSARNNTGINTLFKKIAQKILDPNFDFTANEDKKEQYENEIKDLKDKLNKANKIIEKQNIEIQELKNTIKSFKKEENYNQINNLKNEINIKNNEINQLKQQLQNININNKGNLVYLGDIKSVSFISSDQSIFHSIPCSGNSIFAEVEEQLYKEYPEYRETNNTFIANGKEILRFKTINDNEIGTGKPVILVKPS